MRARGMGAHVIVTEVDPVRALEAAMDGFEVMPMERAAELGDIFCTATGDKNVITRAHFERMKDGAILANTGHFNVEIEIAALRDLAVETREARALVDEFTLADGRRLYLLGDGRLVNLAAAEGHPASSWTCRSRTRRSRPSGSSRTPPGSSGASTTCRRRSTRRSRGSSSRRWASRSTG